ncbi:MAG TPA: DNA topoisomerase IB [Opitutus sp.]|nr:DNA topoisomerase IB [Opitutus sp.]
MKSAARAAKSSPPPASPKVQRAVPPTPEALAAAKEAGLRYVTDESPGIARELAGDKASYRSPDGKRITDRDTLARVKRLAIPPAWTQVWICPAPNGHIQATGRDARGRKQYRYHPDWSAVRDGAKFERMIAFGKALPKIRRQVKRDLARRGLDRRKVLAAVVRLLETTLVRIGNEEYAKQNRSFGLTTMRDRHVKIGRGTLHFEFRGKSGKQHEIDLHDPRLAEIVRRAQELPGQDLFQYLDDDEQPQKIGSADVNEYLREVAGEEFSAKDFRTWAGTVLAAVALRELEGAETKVQTKKNLVQAIESVAQRLGNTPAVCRKCYIHPIVLESYLDGVTLERVKAKAEEALAAGRAERGGVELNEEERAVLKFLQRKLPTTEERLAASLKAERKKRAA